MFVALIVAAAALLPLDRDGRADRPLSVQVQIVTEKQLGRVINRKELPIGLRLDRNGTVLNMTGNDMTLWQAAGGCADFAKKSTYKQVVLKVLETDKTQTERLRKFMTYLEAALEKGQFVVVFVILIEPE